MQIVRLINGPYQYTLRVKWVDEWPPRSLGWILLNPSVGDDPASNATVKRMIHFTKKLGYSSFFAVNLFAYRTANPRDLLTVSDPIGPRNDEYIDWMLSECTDAVIAWGNKGAWRGRDKEVRPYLGRNTIYCLGKTKLNQPQHPLYIPSATEPIVLFRPARDHQVTSPGNPRSHQIGRCD